MGNAEGLYESLTADLNLGGHKPRVIVVDRNNEIYISIKDAAIYAKLTTGRLRGLVSKERIKAIQPGGRDSFIGLNSLNEFLSSGRKEPGRPRKDE